MYIYIFWEDSSLKTRKARIVTGIKRDPIRKGVTVKLKSGGLPMTVVDVRIDPNPPNEKLVSCEWMDATGTLQNREFPISVLGIVKLGGKIFRT
jgi:uncharacterized protein YodC (DUF2158 family)